MFWLTWNEKVKSNRPYKLLHGFSSLVAVVNTVAAMNITKNGEASRRCKHCGRNDQEKNVNKVAIMNTDCGRPLYKLDVRYEH